MSKKKKKRSSEFFREKNVKVQDFWGKILKKVVKKIEVRKMLSLGTGKRANL